METGRILGVQIDTQRPLSEDEEKFVNDQLLVFKTALNTHLKGNVVNVDDIKHTPTKPPLDR